MDDPVDGDVWDDFGQKVDLTARLREILLNYPEGTSILKELVQNAVRAPSSIPSFRIVAGCPVLNDPTPSPLPKTPGRCRREDGEGMPRRALARHRHAGVRGPRAVPGPVAAGVQRLHVQGERLRVDLAHRRLGQADAGWQDGALRRGFQQRLPPHGHALVRQREARGVLRPALRVPAQRHGGQPGQARRFRRKRRQAAPDQWARSSPSCDVRTRFRGTMFRFPLRTETQAGRSKLSKAHYTESVRALLLAFARRDAGHALPEERGGSGGARVGAGGGASVDGAEFTARGGRGGGGRDTREQERVQSSVGGVRRGRRG